MTLRVQLQKEISLSYFIRNLNLVERQIDTNV